MMKLDVSTTSVVVTCTDCEHWYGFAFSRHEALMTGARHEERVHQESMRARKTLWEWEKRHAV